jgi:hypothetical protein
MAKTSPFPIEGNCQVLADLEHKRALTDAQSVRQGSALDQLQRLLVDDLSILQNRVAKPAI